MDHKTFLASLAPEEVARLSRRSDAAGLIHLAGHLGLILFCGALIAMQVPFWGALLPVQGVLIIALFTLEHEATHKTPFASEGLNEWIGRLCGLLVVLPFEWFRYFHLAHHRYTNIPSKDPELASDKPDTWRRWLWHVSGLPIWASQARQLVVNAFGRAEADYLPERAKARLVREARIMLAVYGLVGLSLFTTPVLLWVWLVPILLGQPFLRLYLLAEHGKCPFVANMFDNTRTTFTNRIVRFLAWNMPYHVEHHVAPNVPFHQLPAFHQLTRAHLKHTEEGYAAFTAKWVADL